MTTQEKIWFDALVKDREDNARVLAKDSMAGYRQSPIDKYSDQAHFVYEFLQNADDTKASKCVFALNSDGLIFRHNGKISFSVSDPRKEAEDRKYGRLGSVNAITAAGLSSKSGNDIGRFGIGFKAVFQYTDKPKIYDDGISFGLRDEIVPFLLENDFESRKRGETCFYIPFRAAEKVRAHKEIGEKIASITYPLLFLSSLKEISFESSDGVGRYSKEVCETKEYNQDKACIDLEFVILKREFGRERTETKFLKFSRTIEGRMISVVFGVDNVDGKIHLVPLQVPAFCFFPTKKDTDLRFLIHAPFLLNDSREGIKVGQPHNENLIAGLSALAVLAVNLMVTKLPAETHNWFGYWRRGIKLIDDGILDFVPLNQTNRPDEVSFLPFTICFMAAFIACELIPCQEGDMRALCYQKKGAACWSSDNRLIQLLTSDQLTFLLGQQRYWGFATINKPREDQERFIKTCCEIVEWSSIRTKLTAAFFERQPVSWFERFFDYILNSTWNIDIYKTLPMFLDCNNKAVAAFDEEDNRILYLPSEGVSISRTINPKLLKFAAVKNIVDRWNITKESRLSVVKRIIREDLVNGDDLVYTKGLLEVLRFCQSCSDDDLNKVSAAFNELAALIVYNPVSNRRWRAKADDSYYDADDLRLYFKGCESIAFVDVGYLKDSVGNEDHAVLEKLLSVLAIRRVPKCFTELRRPEVVSLYGAAKKWHYSYKQPYEKWEDFYISRSKDFFERFTSEADGDLKKRMSIVFWRFLCRITSQVVPGHSHIEDTMKGVHKYYYDYAWQTEVYEPLLKGLLKNTIWLFDNNGEFKAHADLFVETLSEEYDVESKPAKQLLEFLGIEHNERMRALGTLSDEERLDLSLAKDIRDCGFGSLTEVKDILANIPDEVRRKISEGRLTSTEILKAVRLLECTEKGSADPIENETVGHCEIDWAGQTVEEITMAGNSGWQPKKLEVIEKGEKHKAGDYEMEDSEYDDIMRLFEDGLTGESNSDDRKKDESKLACLRLFRYLERENLKPSMNGHSDIEYIVKTLYAGFGKTGPNIDVKTGEKWHVISAMGGVAYIPPRWWQKIVDDRNGINVICAVAGANTDDFKVIRGREDIAKYVRDDAIPIKVRGRDAVDRIDIVSNAFRMVDSSSNVGKIYALLRLREKTSMNSAFAQGYCNDEKNEIEASEGFDEY